MAKKPAARGATGIKKRGSATAAAVPTITVVEADKRPYDELMKLPKAHIIRDTAIPENKTRFLVDVDNQSKQGKKIIALMESLRDGHAAATKTVTEILVALAGMVSEKPAPKK